MIVMSRIVSSTVLIAFLLFGSIVYSETTVAAPAITGVSGTLGTGSQVTVTGSGFGSKSQAAPWLYDDFDSGASNGTSIVGRASPTGGRAWSYYDMSGGGGPTLYDNSQAYNGSYSATESNAGNGNNAWVGGMGMQKRYMSYRFRWNGNGSGVMKFDRTSSGTQQGNANPPYDACPNFGWGNTDGGYVNSCDAFTSWLGWPLSPPSMAQDTWHRIETYFEIGSHGIANGTFMIWVDNVLYSNYRNSVVTCGNSAAVCQIDTWIMLLTANGGTLQSWTDDVYIDSTLQRVEICDASTWASRTHCEIQLPGAWTDSSVTVSSRLANFSAGSTVYVYAIDSSGAHNPTGYPVVVGSETTTYTVTPSAGANGSISPNTAQAVNSGSTTIFTVTANAGYTASVGGTCGGSPSTADGTFTYTTSVINANCSVTATFVGDTTPPVISAPQPSGERPYGTSSVTLQVTTNEAATCRYSVADVSYASMGSTFGTTGGTNHQQTGFVTTNGSSYTRYVRCIDSVGNASATSTLITFSVAATNDVIFDNDGAGVTQSGDWSASTYFPGYYGSNYHYAPDAAGSWFQWSGTLSAGNHAVYARWPAAAGRPNDAVYEITHSGGTASVSANQTTAGGQWNLLGTYTFGTTGTVRLLSSANGTEGAAADAIRFSASAADTTPPTLSSLLPSGDLPAPTTSVNLAVTTNEAATCRFGPRDTQYSGMAVLGATGSTSHSHTLATRYGGVYETCFRCQDGSANVSTESCTRFAVPDLPRRRGSH